MHCYVCSWFSIKKPSEFRCVLKDKIILSDDNFVIKSKYYSLIYSSCFDSYLEFSKMSLFFGMFYFKQPKKT